MLRPSAALLILAFAGLFSPAHANGNSTLRAVPYGALKCPFPVDNGCSGSIAGQPGSTAVLLSNARQAPAGNMVNLLSGSPTDYSVSGPQKNIAGMDYYVGEYTPVGSLTPVTSGTIPTGCSLAATPSISGGTLMTCLPGSFLVTAVNAATPSITTTEALTVGQVLTLNSHSYTVTGGGPTVWTVNTGTSLAIGTAQSNQSTDPLNITGYDFTNGGSGTGTTCIALLINGNASGLVTITDNYWLNNGRCVTSSAAPTMLQLSGRNTSSTIISYNTLDANKSNFPYPYGSCAPGSGLTATVTCNPSEAELVAGDATLSYNALIGFTARPIQYGAFDSSVGFLYEYNALIGCCSVSPAAHNEYTEYVEGGNVTGNGHSYIGNLFITTTFHQNTGFAAIPMGLPNGFNQLGPTPIFNVSDNFYVDSIAGGGSIHGVKPTYTGSITGGVFTTSAISGGLIGSGYLLSCGPGNEVSFLAEYNPSYVGTVSAGPGGGGNSNGNAVTNWDMTWGSTSITAQLDNGSGGSGTIMTVNADVSLNLAVGYNVAFGGTVGTRQIQSILSGGPTTGTYQMSGVAGIAVNGSYGVTPVNQSPGGWTVPGTLPCSSRTSVGFGYSWSNPFITVQGNAGQVTNVGNYMDLWAFGGSSLGTVNFENGTATQSFTAQISGTNLTITNGTVNSTSVGGGGGSGYASAPSVAYGAGCTTTPVGTAVLGSGVTAGQVVSITQNVSGSGCSAVPLVTLSGGGFTTPATATANATWPTVTVGNAILTTSGVLPATVILSGSAPNFVVSQSQTIGPVAMQAIGTFCLAPPIWSTTNPNVDMTGATTTAMNSFGTSAVTGNGCGP